MINTFFNTLINNHVHIEKIQLDLQQCNEADTPKMINKEYRAEKKFIIKVDKDVLNY